MKKIILAVAIVCSVAVSHGAAVGWTAMGATDYSTYDIFVIGLNGVTSVSQIEGIVAAGGLSAAADYAFGGGALNNGLAMAVATSSGKAISYKAAPATEQDNTYTAVIFVQDAAGTKASYSGTASVTLANDSTTKTFLFNNQAAAFSSNSFTVNTPEPTSGVLLLLGMAGLALKRKRA